MKILSKLGASAVFILPLIILNGCGGGSSSTLDSNSLDTSPELQPHELSSNSFSEARLLSRDGILAPTLTYDATSITISFTVSNGVSVPHYQFFLNVDGDNTTGYGFGNMAWGNIGADYLIEDGDLYKSTASGHSWDWDIQPDSVNSVVENNSFTIVIPRSELANLSSKVSLGFMVRDEDWLISDIYPQSSQMTVFTIENPISTDTEAPTLSLNGSDAMRITKGSVFHDPGVYAYDEIDGDISNQAVVSYSNNTDAATDVVATQSITYTVTDLAGNSSTITRAYTVVQSPVAGIVIDGEINDWENVAEVASNSTGTIKVENNYGYLNILVNAPELGENTQIFLDVDNDSTTGMQFLGGDWDFGGADYMVENRDLNKSTNPYAWSWDYGVAPIHYIKKGGVIEIAILKSSLESLGNTINIGFVNRDSNWNISHEMLPATGMVPYTLTSAYTQVPSIIRSMLCDVNQTIPVEATYSLEDGFNYNGKQYFSERVVSGENTILSIYSQNLDNSDKVELLSFIDTPNFTIGNTIYGAVLAGVRSVNGGLIISIRPDNQNQRSSRRDFYRISDEGDVIEYGDNGFSDNIGKSLGFVENTYYQTYKDLRNPYTTSLYSYNEINEEIAKVFSEKLDIYSFDPIYPLRSLYENGVIYYAYTPGQLVNNRILTNVGPRIIGVIDDDSGLKPVSVCETVNGI